MKKSVIAQWAGKMVKILEESHKNEVMPRIDAMLKEMNLGSK